MALVTAGVEMDVLGLTYPEYSEAEREAVVHAHPRTERFKQDIIQAFYDGIKHAGDDLRQRQGRRDRRQGAALPSRQLLQRDPRLRLARLINPPTKLRC